jgi:hypothetical protein
VFFDKVDLLEEDTVLGTMLLVDWGLGEHADTTNNVRTNTDNQPNRRILFI